MYQISSFQFRNDNTDSWAFMMVLSHRNGNEVGLSNKSASKKSNRNLLLTENFDESMASNQRIKFLFADSYISTNCMSITIWPLLQLYLLQKNHLYCVKVRLNQRVPYFKGSDIIQKKRKMYRRMINRLIQLASK